MLRFFRVFTALLMVSLAAGPVGQAFAQPSLAEGKPMILPVDPDRLEIETASGATHSFSIEVAGTDLERSAGLMFRDDMDDDHGMLFVFDTTRRLSFWMQNTPMPLDLIFIGEDGRIVAIRWGQPFSTASISPLTPGRFVLELKAGTAQKAGIAEGDRVRHPRIDEVAGTR